MRRFTFIGECRNHIDGTTACIIIVCLNRARWNDGLYVDPGLSILSCHMAKRHFGGALPPTSAPLQAAQAVPWVPSGRYLS
jgi:hypothetical protein